MFESSEYIVVGIEKRLIASLQKHNEVSHVVTGTDYVRLSEALYLTTLVTQLTSSFIVEETLDISIANYLLLSGGSLGEDGIKDRRKRRNAEIKRKS